MAKVNMDRVKFAVATAKGYPAQALRDAADNRAADVFEDAVIGMQVEFEDHPVTREIAGGIYADNVSRTLGGGRAPKNLFAFIGFKNGSDPLEPIRDAMNPDSKVGRSRKTKSGSPIGPTLTFKAKTVKSNNARFSFEVKAPDKQAIYKRTPMPWASGLSWAQKIETHIPGFGNFLARYMPSANDAISRSKGGTQLKREIREDEYSTPSEGYLTTIFFNFLAKVREYNAHGLKRRF